MTFFFPQTPSIHSAWISPRLEEMLLNHIVLFFFNLFFHAISLKVIFFLNKQPTCAECADILVCLLGCWRPCIPIIGSSALIQVVEMHQPHSHASTSLCFLISNVLAAFPEGNQCSSSQLCIRMSLYSSGTWSGSTGLGKKCVNFWCRLDFVPSLGVPSLFNATK